MATNATTGDAAASASAMTSATLGANGTAGAAMSTSNHSHAAPLAYFAKPSPERLAALERAGPPPSLNSFLSSTRRFLLDLQSCSSNSPTTVHLVLGNEASDMDSVVSSIALAWYLSAVFPLDSTGHVFVPMMNLARAELPLRGEVLYAFHGVGLNMDNLVCKDELDLPALRQRVPLRAVLVDHNNLAADLEEPLGPVVAAIMDHHVDEGRYNDTSAGQRVIEFPTGSCTSLVGELILHNAPWLLSAGAFGPISLSMESPAPLALLTLLHQTLLMDTSNMSSTAGKVTPVDRRMEEAYAHRGRGLLYAEMHRRRNDVAHLTTEQLLLKDTKYGDSQTYPYFIASVPGSMASWAGRDHDILGNIEKFARARQVRFLIILTAFIDPSTNHSTTHQSKGSSSKQAAPNEGSTHAASSQQVAEAVQQAGGPEAGATSHSIPTSDDNKPLAHSPESKGTFKREISLMVLGDGEEAHPQGQAGARTAEQLMQVLTDALLNEGPDRKLDAVLDPAVLPASVRQQAHSGLLVATFNQRNVKGSRKQVAPLIEGIVSKL